MSELADLYQRVVIDHNRSPRNYRVVDPASHQAEGFNPLCGDRVQLYLDVRDGVIRDVGFQGDACAIATASASLLTQALMGRTLTDALAVARGFEAELDAGAAGPGQDRGPDQGQAQTAGLGDLSVLLAVRHYPGRDKCARLPWRALEAALSGQEAQSVSTEAID